MKKILIIVINVINIAAILGFVVLYSGFENYLEGEQRICDVWARYINNKDMTLEEATEYIRSSHVLKDTSAHLIFRDTLTGLSTRPNQGTTDNYDVSYERVNVLDSINWNEEIGASIKITRAYTNPVNGEQSLSLKETASRTPAFLNSTNPIIQRILNLRRSYLRRSLHLPVRSQCSTRADRSAYLPLHLSMPLPDGHFSVLYLLRIYRSTGKTDCWSESSR